MLLVRRGAIGWPSLRGGVGVCLKEIAKGEGRMGPLRKITLFQSLLYFVALPNFLLFYVQHSVPRTGGVRAQCSLPRTTDVREP